MDEFYEVDLLDDLPIPQPQAPMVRVGSMSDATSVASTTFSHGGSSGALRRAGTPMPNSTLRESQRERLRELIDCDKTSPKKAGTSGVREKPKKQQPTRRSQTFVPTATKLASPFVAEHYHMMNSHHQDSVVLNSPSSSPALPPRAAPVGGKTCPVGHIYKPHLPHHALPPITPPHPVDKTAPKSPVDRTKEHDTDDSEPAQDNQPVEEQNYIPEAVEETAVHTLLGQAAKRQYI